MNFDKYKNNKLYPKKEDYNLWRLSIIDSKTLEIIANKVVPKIDICDFESTYMLEFGKENIDERMTYIEFGPHTLDYDIKDGKILLGENFRYYIKDGEKWHYPELNYFHLKFERLGKCDNKYKELKDEYNEESKRIYEEFKNDLFEELDITDNPKKEILFSKAWDMSHSYGFESVYYKAEDLVELIK